MFVHKGVEGAATNAEIKTLTEQNNKLKEAVIRYVLYCRDMIRDCTNQLSTQ